MTARDVLAAYEQRINLHDFDRLVDLIAPDATFWFSDGCYRGHPEIRAAFERTWAALNNDSYWLTDKHWVAAGAEVAVCSYRFHWKSLQAGRAISGCGQGTSVLCQTAGTWQIVHEHLSKLADQPDAVTDAGPMTQGPPVL